MTDSKIHKLLTYFIAMVWLVNGLVCKVLGLVPRHGQIVARILGDSHAEILTKAIGFAEIGMALWVVSRTKPKLNAFTQITIIAAMNVLEPILAPDLLLWGKLNAFFALLFIVLIYYHGFILQEKIVTQK